MEKIKEHEIKDAILEYLANTESIIPHIEHIAKSLNLDHYLISYLADDLRERKLIKVAVEDKDDIGQLWISHRGIYFLKSGGFSSEFKSQNKIKVLNTAKITANIANTIIIVSIAAAGVWVTFDSKQKDAEIRLLFEKLQACQNS